MRSAEIKNYVKVFPIIRSIGKTIPEYHLGGIWENRLGLQIYRALLKNLLRNLWKKSVDEEIKHYIEILNRDGVCAISNFLPEDKFQSVLKEFKKAIENAELKPFKGFENGKLFRTQLSVAENPDAYPEIRNLFQKNKLLNKIVSAVINREIDKDPTVFLDKYLCLNINGIDNDVENILHADLHTPTVKMFFYINEVNAKNGAFVYAKGSQKLTFERLLHEFDLSIRQAKLRKGKRISEKLLENRGEEYRNIISTNHYKKMKIVETQICVQPNTLVISNNMGFHRRGDFLDGTPRESILINYRNAERIFF